MASGLVAKLKSILLIGTGYANYITYPRCMHGEVGGHPWASWKLGVTDRNGDLWTFGPSNTHYAALCIGADEFGLLICSVSSTWKIKE